MLRIFDDVCKPLDLEETSLSLGSSVHRGEEQGLCMQSCATTVYVIVCTEHKGENLCM